MGKPNIHPPFGAVHIPYFEGLNCCFIKSLFCPINASPNDFLVRTSLDPPTRNPLFWEGGGSAGGGVKKSREMSIVFSRFCSAGKPSNLGALGGGWGVAQAT